MKYFNSPSALLYTISTLEPENHEYIIVRVNEDHELTTIVLTEEVEYRNTIKDIIKTGYYTGDIIFIRGSATYNPSYLDAYCDEIKELAAPQEVLDILCVNWIEGTYYSDMCDNPKDCCGPDNQQSYTDI